MDEQRQDDQLETISNSSVPIQDVVLKTYLYLDDRDDDDGCINTRTQRLHKKKPAKKDLL